MLYSCTHMATVGVKGLKHDGSEFGLVDNAKGAILLGSYNAKSPSYVRLSARVFDFVLPRVTKAERRSAVTWRSGWGSGSDRLMDGNRSTCVLASVCVGVRV